MRGSTTALKLELRDSIKTLTDLINKSRYYVDTFGRDTRFRDVKSVLQDANKPSTLDVRDRDANRAAIQQTVMQCMATLNLDAVTYPTGNVPAALIKAPVEPDVNGRSHQAWTLQLRRPRASIREDCKDC